MFVSLLRYSAAVPLHRQSWKRNCAQTSLNRRKPPSQKQDFLWSKLWSERTAKFIYDFGKLVCLLSQKRPFSRVRRYFLELQSKHINFMQGSEGLTRVSERIPAEIKVWIGFFFLVLFVWYFCSSGDFSFLLTLAALLRMFGISVLNYKVLFDIPYTEYP